MTERGRIDWIDCLKGATVLLVVVYHGLLAYSTVGAPDTLFSKLAYYANMLLGSARMPSFFLCGGIVINLLKKDRLEWFLSKRFPFALWCIILWTVIYATIELLGLKLYPWGSLPYIAYKDLFIVPYGAIWFIYALFLMSFWGGLVRKLSPAIQYGLSILLCVVLIRVSELDGLHVGQRHLLRSIALQGLPFFMLGVCFGRLILDGLSQRYRALEVAFVAAAFLTSVAWMGPFANLPETYLRMFPITALFIVAVRLCSDSQLFHTTFSKIGTVSLEVFLSHQIVLALLFLVAGRYISSMWPPLGITFFTVGTVAATVIICIAMPTWLRKLLFTTPAWFYALTERLTGVDRVART